MQKGTEQKHAGLSATSAKMKQQKIVLKVLRYAAVGHRRNLSSVGTADYEPVEVRLSPVKVCAHETEKISYAVVSLTEH